MTDNERPQSNCETCPTRRFTEWQQLSQDELKSLSAAKRTRTLSAGTSLYNQGDVADGIYCIQSGLVGLRLVDEQGNSTLLKTVSGGATIGYKSLLGKQPHTMSAETLLPSDVCFIEKSFLAGMLARNPSLGERFLEHALTDIRELEANYARSLTMDAKARFIHLVLVYYHQTGFRDESGNPSVDIPIKRSDLAEQLGVQPESMSRLIKKLQTEGLLRVEDRRVTITKFEYAMFVAGITL